MRFAKIGCALFTILSIVGCSNGSNGSSGARKPADPQASKQLTTSFAALQQFQQSKTQSRHVSLFSTAVATNPVQQKEVEKLSAMLGQKLNNKDCTFTLPSEEAPSNKPGDGVQVDIRDMVFEIRGEKCPMTAYIKVFGGKDTQNIRARFEMGMNIRAPDLQKEMNLVDGVYAGDITGVVAQNSGSDAKMILNGTFNGQGRTLEHGPFASSSNFSLNFESGAPTTSDTNHEIVINMKFDVAEKSVYTFGDEQTVLSSRIVMGPQGATQEYFVNDQPVSAEKYAEYASKINIPGFNMGDQISNTPSQKPASLCEILAFDARVVSEQQILDVLRQTQSTDSLVSKASGFVSSCGEERMSMSSIGGQRTMLKLTFETNSNTALVDVNGMKKSLSLQPEFEEQITSTVSGVSLVFSCKPVTTCSN